MGPAIILDKNALQSLSAAELFFLYKYFNVVIPSVLIYEILGDLQKGEDSEISKQQVTDLANKIYSSDSVLNVSHFHLIEAEMAGEQITLDYRPLVAAEQVQTIKGETGYVVEPTPEQQAIQRWRVGDFSDSELLLAKDWRETTLEFDLDGLKSRLQPILGDLPRVTSHSDLSKVADEFIQRYDNNPEILHLAKGIFDIEPDIFGKALARFIASESRTLQEFAPYTHYCLKVTLILYFGLHLIGPRSTNVLDFQYIYYLPFCEVFVSNDKLHKNIVPSLIGPNQLFIDGESLKSDLAKLAMEWNEMDADSRTEQWDKKYGTIPPPNKESPVYQAWENSRHWHLDNNFGSVDSSTEPRTTEPDFIEIKRYITANDPCPCRSGKKFGDCCLDKVDPNHGG